MTFEIIRPTSQEMYRDHEQRMVPRPIEGNGGGEPVYRSKTDRSMYRGDTFQIAMVIVDECTGSPIDIAGWTIRFTAKFAIPNPDAQAGMRQDNQAVGGVTIVTPTMGEVLIAVQPIVTRGYPDGDVFLMYDVQVTDGEGVITTVELGTLTVCPDVTRAIS
jgi:hypothetical protein